MSARAVSLVMAAVAAVAVVALAAAIPYRARRRFAGAGARVLALPGGSRARTFAIFAVSAALIVVVPLRAQPPYLSLVMLGCAVLGAKMAADEAAGLGRSGVYEHAVALGTAFVRYDEILSLPTLSYEDDAETSEVDKTALKIILKDGGTVELPFGTEELRARAVEAILSQAPHLRPE